jgi:hypothetical protein
MKSEPSYTRPRATNTTRPFRLALRTAHAVQAPDDVGTDPHIAHVVSSSSPPRPLSAKSSSSIRPKLVLLSRRRSATPTTLSNDTDELSRSITSTAALRCSTSSESLRFSSNVSCGSYDVDVDGDAVVGAIFASILARASIELLSRRMYVRARARLKVPMTFVCRGNDDDDDDDDDDTVYGRRRPNVRSVRCAGLDRRPSTSEVCDCLFFHLLDFVFLFVSSERTITPRRANTSLLCLKSTCSNE